VRFLSSTLEYVLNLIEKVYFFLTKNIINSRFYDQQIPLQSVFRTRLEYYQTRYKSHEVYSPAIDDNHPAHNTRQLRLAYDPQIIPQPYYFHIEDGLTFRNGVVDTQNPRRLFLENYPETTLIEERANYTFSLTDQARVKTFSVLNKSEDHDLAYFFTGPWVNNYYHFIVDYCMKYNELVGGCVINDDYKIIYHNKMRKWQSDFYGLIGIGTDRLVSCNTTPLRVKRLLIASNRRHRFAVSNSAIQGFKDTVFERLGVYHLRSPSKRFYISRKNYETRRILNEDEVISCLEAFDFQVVHPELLSIPDQIELFSKAEAIVAPHGAGLANMIFATSPKIIELIPEDLFKFGYFIGLTYSIGGQHFPLICAPENAEYDFRVSIKDLGEILNKL